MSLQNVLSSHVESEDEQWITISDLMAGLMVIFLFIAITYIRPVKDERETIRDIAVTFQEAESDLYRALWNEFKDDLPKWGAELDKETLSVRLRLPKCF